MELGTPGSVLGIDLPKGATMMWGEAGREVGAALLSKTLTYKHASSSLLAQPSALGSDGFVFGQARRLCQLLPRKHTSGPICKLAQYLQLKA